MCGKFVSRKDLDSGAAIHVLLTPDSDCSVEAFETLCKHCNQPVMETIAIDLETYYDREISIKPMGVDAYLRHPDTNLYLISLYSENADGETTLDWCGTPDDPEAPWDRVKGCHAVAHNARFDETAWLYNVEKGAIPEDCLPAKWSCTADLAVYLSAPRSLLGAAKELLNAEVSKAYRGTALGKNWEDFTDDERKEILAAGTQDAFYSFQLWNHFHTHWPEHEQAISRQNREMGRRGIAVDTKLLGKNIKSMERTLFEAGRMIPWEWGGSRSKTPLLKKEIAEECRKVGIKCPISFAQDSKDAQEWEEQYADTYPWIGALKVWRRGAGFLAKLRNIEERNVDGIYPFTLKYFGAHTGRLSGDGGFNMQNIYRDERFGMMLRHIFVPRPGYKFLIADYAQIEARILAWVCEMEETLRMVRDGLSIYEVHAINTMGWKAKNGSLKKVDPGLYLLAKARVLALGYQCGPPKFQVMAHTLCGLNLSGRECINTVYDFRNTNPEITNHWRTLQAQAQQAARKPSRRYRLELPSGRALDYFDVNLADGMQARTQRGGTAYHYYGGKFTENEIQAIGRDIMTDAKLACAKRFPEFPIVLDVHDELVFEVPESMTEAEAQTVANQMCTASGWTEGLPLEVEWSFETKYVK
jgi:DNA polymerase I-like protein with 3'-5' exonuclease and polymerase domains